LQNTEIVGLCDINPAAIPANTADIAPFFQDYRVLLQQTSPDIVCVCTPNNLHAPIALAALSANAHVIIEKPMALRKTDCEALIMKALQVQRHVFCVMQNRYSPPAAWLKTCVESGILGQLFMVQINCYWNRDDRYYANNAWKGKRSSDGGPLFTQFSHFIDLLYWLFGDIAVQHTRFHNYNHTHSTDFEDTGIVQFQLVEGGGMGCINYSTAVWDANLESSITVVSENGSLKIGGQYMDKVEYCHIKNYKMPILPDILPPNDYGAYKGSAANHHFVFENVLQTLNGAATATTNAVEGLKVVDIIERIYTSR
jgi:UDP-N-acetyl-2-amino-2-deoxyglucuronate dehydrogenase